MAGGCALAGYDFAQRGLQCADVSFYSPGNTSGNTTIYGSVVRPSTVEALLPPVVLIPGSGPTNRWESALPDPMSEPFLDIAVALATHGVAVLAFDKRSCSPTDPVCADRVFCASVAHGTLPACADCSGCVDVFAVTLYDFVADGAAGMEYLVAQDYTLASAESQVLVGHSQGCVVAQNIPLSTGSMNVVLLEGIGSSYDSLLAEQAAFQNRGYEAKAQYLSDQGLTEAAFEFPPDAVPGPDVWRATVTYLAAGGWITRSPR